MDDIQLKYKRLLGYEEHMLQYQNYRVVYGIFDDIDFNKMLFKRAILIKACCYTHAWDIALEFLNDNEEILELKDYGNTIRTSVSE